MENFFLLLSLLFLLIRVSLFTRGIRGRMSLALVGYNCRLGCGQWQVVGRRIVKFLMLIHLLIEMVICWLLFRLLQIWFLVQCWGMGSFTLFTILRR